MRHKDNVELPSNLKTSISTKFNGFVGRVMADCQEKTHYFLPIQGRERRWCAFFQIICISACKKHKVEVMDVLVKIFCHIKLFFH